MNKPKVKIRISASLLERMMLDLKRPHKYAHERVGYSYSRSTKLSNGDWIICFFDYEAIKDSWYLKDSSVGAHINADAVNQSIQRSYTEQVGSFHTHLHDFSSGIPEWSCTDLDDLPKLPKNALRYSKQQPHGLLLLGSQGVNALVLLPDESELIKPELITVVGSPLGLNFISKPLTAGKSDRYDRQSFLGKYSEDILSKITIGIVGLGGGGSHIVQQLAHIGIQNYVLYDYDYVSESNLNRLVGATRADAKRKTLKYDVMCRVIRGLQPNANIAGASSRWQEHEDTIKKCDVVIGCVDGLATRRDLESENRRYLIPFIDIGMDVYTEFDDPKMFGQVQLSMPSKPCMQCSNYLSETDLAIEAGKYGAGGGRPQVVWPNATLASTAIGIMIDIITGWSGESLGFRYIDYLGNKNLLSENLTMKHFAKKVCEHYPIKECGPLTW